MPSVPEVLPVNEARTNLSRLLAGFREQGLCAEPVFVGSHRRPEGVLVSIELFDEMAPFIEDVLIAREARRRLARRSGDLVTHDELLAELEIAT